MMRRSAALRRKWLAFRALEARSQDTLHRPQRPIVQAALAICAVGCVVLCSLNDRPFRYSGQLRGVAQALFCVAAAALYILFMLMYSVVSWVVFCAEDRQSNLRMRYYDPAEFQECVELCAGGEEGEEEGDDNEDAEEARGNNNIARGRRHRTAGDAASANTAAAGCEAVSGDNKASVVGVPREVVISSMYLGGTGIFLAVAPLCMWDCAVTLSFVGVLFLVSVVDVPSFRRGRMHWTTCVGMVFALAMALAVEATSRMPITLERQATATESWIQYYLRLHPLFGKQLFTASSSSSSSAAFAASQSLHVNNNGTHQGNQNNNNHNNNAALDAVLHTQTTLADHDSETQAALLLVQASSPPLWPFLIFAGLSPILLRAGGGSVYVGGLYHAMTPVQTLETGIPITILLAGLVLSWFSPLEAALLQTREMVQMETAIPMLVLAPPCMGATLAFVLHSLRRRAALLSSALLLLILTVRQQFVHRSHGEHNLLDVATVTVASLCTVGATWIALDTFDDAEHLPPTAPPASSVPQNERLKLQQPRSRRMQLPSASSLSSSSLSPTSLQPLSSFGGGYGAHAAAAAATSTASAAATTTITTSTNDEDDDVLLSELA